MQVRVCCAWLDATACGIFNPIGCCRSGGIVGSGPVLSRTEEPPAIGGLRLKLEATAASGDA